MKITANNARPTCPLTGEEATRRLQVVMNGGMCHWHVSEAGEAYLRREHPHADIYGPGEKVPTSVLRAIRAGTA